MSPSTPHTARRPLRGFLYALGAAALWASSATAAKYLFDPSLPPLALAQTRSLVGFVVLFPFLLVVRPAQLRLRGRDLPFLALVGLNFVLLHGTYYAAIARMPVAVAILVQDLAPLLILGWVRLTGRRPVARSLWLAALLCLCGCALVAGVVGSAPTVSGTGLLIGLASAGAYASYILVAERGAHRFPPGTLLCYGLGFAALFWGVPRPWWNFPLAALNTATLSAVFLIGVGGTLLPFALLSAALRYIPAGPAGIATTAEPVIAALLAYRCLGERLALSQVAGGVVVMAGILLAQRASQGLHARAPDETASNSATPP
ncbi:MAG: EamA family transporter [Armatimonadota bacterium]|nr:EamA family transporter [Armatimonadota bacterium]